jgi:hypothetical protein
MAEQAASSTQYIGYTDPKIDSTIYRGGVRTGVDVSVVENNISDDSEPVRIVGFCV